MTTLIIREVGATDIDTAIKETGLQIADGKDVKDNYLPFLERIHALAEQAKTINAVQPTAEDEKLARDIRLQMVKIRTGADKLKTDRKKEYLLKGNLEQACFNIVKNTCELAEDALLKVEKYSEEQERLRKENLRITREQELKAYCENPGMYPLGEMREKAYADLKEGLKLAYEARLKREEEEQAEIERQRQAEERQNEVNRLTMERRVELATKYGYKFTGEKALGEMPDEEYQLVIDKAQMEKDAKDKAETDRKAELEKLRKEQEEKDAELARQKAENERLAADARKRAAEEEKQRIEAENAKKQAEKEAKKLAKAPVKKRVGVWVDAFVAPEISGIEDEDAAMVAKDILAKFESFKVWAKARVETL